MQRDHGTRDVRGKMCWGIEWLQYVCDVTKRCRLWGQGLSNRLRDENDRVSVLDRVEFSALARSGLSRRRSISMHSILHGGNALQMFDKRC